MKNNSKSTVKIQQLMLTFPMLVILTITIQLFGFAQNETQIADKQTNMENKIDTQEDIQIASEDRVRENVTSRGNIERGKEEKTYKTIEEITISKNMDLTIRCGISKEDFKKLIGDVKSDTSKFFYDNSDLIYELCEKYEINEIFFCGLIAGESGWNIASNHRKSHNYISMMSKGKLIRYASVEDGLEAAAKLLHTKYLTKGGSCYNGKTLASVQKRFCPNSSTWVNLIYQAMKTIVK